MAPSTEQGPAAAALPKESSFEFVMPWDDASETTLSVRSMNAASAEELEPITTRDGQFVGKKSGKRIRFLGVNIGARAAFPPKDEADRVAGRLAKLGVNLVRFHHLQNDWDPDGGTIWKRDKMHLELDPGQLDKLDYFVAALAKQGIYSNMNLQTSRWYPVAAGLPKSVEQIRELGDTFGFYKKVDKFNRKMIDLQKDYARDLLDRKNPYRNRKYSDDPAVAIIEINNENTIVGWGNDAAEAGLERLPEPFKGELVSIWNRWLTKKYGTERKLLAGWNSDSEPLSAPLLPDQASWEIERHEADVTTSEAPAQKRGTGKALMAEVRQNPGPDWHVQAHLTKVSLEAGKRYTLTFRAKAEPARQIPVSVRLHKPDWRNLGLESNVRVTSEPRDYTLTFTALEADPESARISFTLGGTKGKVELTDVDLRRGAAPYVLPKGASLAKQNIPLVTVGPPQVLADYTEALSDTEKATAEELRTYLRDTLGFTSPISDGQVGFGGITGYWREAEMDLADNHAYWAHPMFDGRGWDPANWTVHNESMLSIMEKQPGILTEQALIRVHGKPFSVSEYNHCAPIDYQAETMPLLAAFAAAQDWDAIYLFDYGHTVLGKPNDAIQGWFGGGTNPAKMAFFPSAALMFRAALVPALREGAVLELPQDARRLVRSAQEGWARAGGAPNVYETRTSVRRTERLGAFAAEKSAASAGQSLLSVRKLAKGNVFVADAPSAKAAVGFVGGSELALEGATLRFPEFGNGFAAVTLVALDGKPVGRSSRLLLTVVGKVENQGMEWNEARNSVADRWGRGPTRAEKIPVDVRVAASSGLSVYELDARGARARKLDATYHDGRVSFSIDGDQASLFYELGAP